MRLSASSGSKGDERDGVFELRPADETYVDICCSISPDAKLPVRIRQIRVVRAR